MSSTNHWSDMLYFLMFRWRWPVIGSLILVVGGTAVFQFQRKPHYSVTVPILVLTGIESSQPTANFLSLHTVAELAVSEPVTSRVYARIACPAGISFSCQPSMQTGAGGGANTPILQLRVSANAQTNLQASADLWADQFLAYMNELCLGLETDKYGFIRQEVDARKAEVDSLANKVRDMNITFQLDARQQDLDNRKSLLFEELHRRQEVADESAMLRLTLSAMMEVLPTISDTASAVPDRSLQDLIKRKREIQIRSQVNGTRALLASQTQKLQLCIQTVGDYDYRRKMLAGSIAILDSVVRNGQQTVQASTAGFEPKPDYRNELENKRSELAILDAQRKEAEGFMVEYRESIDSLSRLTHSDSSALEEVSRQVRLLNTRSAWKSSVRDSFMLSIEQTRVAAAERERFLDRLNIHVDDLTRDYFGAYTEISSTLAERDRMAERQQRLQREFDDMLDRASRYRMESYSRIPNIRKLAQAGSVAVAPPSSPSKAIAGAGIGTVLFWLMVAFIAAAVRPDVEEAIMRNKVDQFVQGVEKPARNPGRPNG